MPPTTSKRVAGTMIEPGASNSCPICHEPLQVGAALCQNCGSPIPKDLIIKAIKYLSDWPHVSWKLTESGLEVEASSTEGFPIFLYCFDTETVVAFGQWHDHFTDPNEASDLFRKAIMGEIRLAVTSRSGIPYKWEVQEPDPSCFWTTRFITGLLIPIPLPKKRIKYLRNQFTDHA